MSFDCSRFNFHPWKDFFGVVMQQGRVQLDADWNEWVAELGRRLQAETFDTLQPSASSIAHAVVPRTTPNGFRILATGGTITIGVGRIYVDGLLAENHGLEPLQWDTVLAELTGTDAVPFFEQPYLPFNATNQPAPADIFNRPVLTGGPLLVYLDVWQRDLTYLQDSDLVEKAVGVDTTARLQTVWQVRVLPNIGDATCGTPDGEVPGWPAIIRSSGARLTNSTGDVPGDPNPCLVPPAAGYKGLENQLYRVEIHRGGPQGTATFKWSRDNATVATRVSEIQGGNRLVVESIGRDEVLGFHAGEWIEILDDWHELHGRPGLLRRIRPGNGVDSATRSILIDDPLPAGLFPVDAQGRTDATRHTRIRRWDQSGMVRRADGSNFHNLDLSASSDGIPVPASGVTLSLEAGILVSFDLESGGEFKTGDHWVFAARVTDGSIELLDHAPPRGIHHHYARLATVTLPDSENDCRVMWPPEATGESCDCTVCVHAEGHNAGTATIQQAIDIVRARGGGTICLDVGFYQLPAPLNLDGAQSIRIRGQGWRTVLQPTQAGGAIDINQSLGVAIENLSILGIAAGSATTAMIHASNCVDLQLTHLTIAAIALSDATSVGIGFSGVLLAGVVRDCTIVAERGIVTEGQERVYLLSANLRVTDNVLMCAQRGIDFGGISVHYGELRLADNLILFCNQGAISTTGGALPAASVTISGNVLHVTGSGVIAGTDCLRIAENEIVATGSRDLIVDGIALTAGLDDGPMDNTYILGNRLRGMSGNGIAIRRNLSRAMIKMNMIENVGAAALSMEEGATASYLCIENNQFDSLGVGFNDQAQVYFGMRLQSVARGDVIGNLFSNVGRQANQNPLRAALGIIASGEIRAAGNRMFGIGPASFIGRTIGIVAGAGFSQMTAEDNAIARIADGTEAPAPAGWQAIVIAATALQQADTTGEVSVNVPGVVVLPTSNGFFHLSAFRAVLLAGSLGSTAVRRNHLRGQLTTLPLVEIVGVGGCLFDQNDAALTAAVAGAAPPLIGRAVCVHASASSNRLVGMGDAPTLHLSTRQFAVLGNLTTGNILVNGSSLPPPWDALNVHI
jgi:hypothetical protein